MKRIITLKVYLIDDHTVDRITYFDNILNKEIELIDEELLNHFEMRWAEELLSDPYDDSVSLSIEGRYLICNNCNQKIEIDKVADNFEFDQLCQSFENIHNNCKEYLEKI